MPSQIASKEQSPIERTMMRSRYEPTCFCLLALFYSAQLGVLRLSGIPHPSCNRINGTK